MASEPAASGPIRVVMKDGVRCVLKQLPPSRSPAAARQYEDLVRTLRGLRHPALARVVGGSASGEGRGRRLLTRWVEGTCAREQVEDGGLDADRTLDVLRALAGGLEHLHAAGVIHRDVAPGNVILTGDGAVLIDYGHAAPAEGALFASAGVVGTPGYVAPEEVLEGPVMVTRAVDVYGLGAVGYALLTGVPPARGRDVLDVLAGAARPATPPSSMGARLSGAFETVLLGALAPEPTERPDAATLVRALASL